MPRIKKLKIQNYETARVVADMLTENTGTHFLDSGGMSGRMWQRNQAAVAKTGHGPVAYFESLPFSKFGWPDVSPHPNHRDSDKLNGIERWKIENGLVDGSYTEAELWVTHSVYHWLKEAVQYAPEVDAALDKLAAQMDEGKDRYDRPSWFEIYREFPDWYARQVAIQKAEEDEGRIEWNETREEGESEMTAEDWVEMHGYEPAKGLYGDGEFMEGYTYNEENCLSQDLHWIYFTLEDQNPYDDGIILIMVHGGADARGGFTRPRAFYGSPEGDAPSWFDWNRYSIYCSECQVSWDSEGYINNEEDNPGVVDLKEYNAREGTAFDAAWLNQKTGVLVGEEKPWIVIDKGDAEYPSDPGVKVYCPNCGKGVLAPYFY